MILNGYWYKFINCAVCNIRKPWIDASMEFKTWLVMIFWSLKQAYYCRGRRKKISSQSQHCDVDDDTKATSASKSYAELSDLFVINFSHYFMS